MAEQVAEALERLQEHAGKRLGDAEDPLLVSVRSGARESMPGMLDTVLNLGLNDASVEGLADARPRTSASPGTPTGASCRCSATSRAASTASASRTRSTASRRDRGVKHDTELDVDALKELTAALQGALRASRRTRRSSCARRSARCSTPGRATARSRTGASTASPTTGAPRSTSSRWSSATRATRRAPASRSAATRSPARPSPAATSSPTPRARTSSPACATPRDIAEMADWLPEAHEQLMEILRTLERHYEDMQDTEFTVEEGRLYMLQTRNAKRPAQAAVRFAVDAVDEGLLTARAGAADDRRRARSTRCCTRRSTPDADYEVLAAGVAASPGAAKGEIVFTAADAVDAARRGPRRRSSCARSPRPTTSPASTPPRASSPPRAARRRTPRWSRAAWAARR